MSDTRGKTLAIFLSVLMVASMVAFAFAGNAAADPIAIDDTATADPVAEDNTGSSVPANETAPEESVTVYNGEFNTSNVTGPNANLSYVVVDPYNGTSAAAPDITTYFPDNTSDFASVTVSVEYNDGSATTTVTEPWLGPGDINMTTGEIESQTVVNVTSAAFNEPANLQNVTSIEVVLTTDEETFVTHGNTIDATVQAFEQDPTNASSDANPVTYSDALNLRDTDGTQGVLSSGEGAITGTIRSEDTNTAIDNGTVWTAPEWQVTSNSIARTFTVDADNAGPAGDPDPERDFFRIWSQTEERWLEAGEFFVTGTAGDQRIADIEFINESDRAQGAGFVGFGKSDGNVSFQAVIFEPGTYSVYQSDTAGNASDFASGGSEAFAFRSEWVAEHDLTPEAMRDRTDETRNDARLHQVTSASEDSGDFVLNDLYTDGDDGYDYWVFGSKIGHDIDAQDAFTVAENGIAELDEPLTVERLTPVADTIDLEKVGTYDSVDEIPQNLSEFDDKSDIAIAEVARDEKIVQVNVTTFQGGEDGLRVNGSATLHVPDVNTSAIGLTPEERFNITGEWLDFSLTERLDNETDVNESVNATNNPDNQTIVIHTGDDGQASVFYRTDVSGENLETSGATEPVSDVTPERAGNQTGFWGELTFNESATDGTHVRFVGVIRPEAAQLSGIVTNERQEPVRGAVAYTEEIDFVSPLRLEITAVYNGDANPDSLRENGQFNVTLFDDSLPGPDEQIRTSMINASEVEVGSSGTLFEDFTRIQPNESFTLWAPTRAEPTEGAYTLPRVPADSEDFTTQFDVRGDLTVAGGDLTGAGTTAATIAQTGTANIVLTGLEELQAVFEVSDLELVPSGNVTVDLGMIEASVMDVSATIDNAGSLSGTQTVELRVRHNETTSAVVASSESISLDPGFEQTVEFDLTGLDLIDAHEDGENVSDGDEADYVAGVFTEDDEQTELFTATFTNETGGDGVDVNGNNQLSQDLGQEFPGMHEDVTGDGTFSIADVQALFNALQDDNPDVVNRPDLFDFSDDGQVSIADVQALFNALQS